MSLHITHETVLRRKQTHLAPFQTDSYMSERDLRSRSDLKRLASKVLHKFHVEINDTLHMYLLFYAGFLR